MFSSVSSFEVGWWWLEGVVVVGRGGSGWKGWWWLEGVEVGGGMCFKVWLVG